MDQRQVQQLIAALLSPQPPQAAAQPFEPQMMAGADQQPAIPQQWSTPTLQEVPQPWSREMIRLRNRYIDPMNPTGAPLAGKLLGGR